MPIIKSAEKAMRGSIRKKAFNDRRKRAMKNIIKKVEKVAETNKEEARKLLNLAFAVIDKTSKRGIIKKNNAARRKSRLSRSLK